MRISPLDAWIAAKIGGPPTPERLLAWQMRALRRTVALAASKSPLYRERLADIDPEALREPADLAKLPLTSQSDLRERGQDFLCVSQGEIARVTTLESSGTTGVAKRVYFTAEDLEATVDFFRHGMTTFTAPGDKVCILMPGARPGGVGDLLMRALERFQASGRIFDLSLSVEKALETILAEGFSTMVCLPVQALALARAARRIGHPGQSRLLRNVLLSADYAARPLIRAVEGSLCERVFIHWGMTETGLGGGVECLARQGCHLREADLFFEIVDPATGAPLPDGETGEIVVSTLARTGMPLVRYRTGDLARITAAPCPCGSLLRRLHGFLGRLSDRSALPGGASLSLAELDAALFPVPGLLDFSAVVRHDQSHCALYIAASFEHGAAGRLAAVKKAALRALAAKGGAAAVHVKLARQEERPLAISAKRTLKIMGEP